VVNPTDYSAGKRIKLEQAQTHLVQFEQMALVELLSVDFGKIGITFVLYLLRGSFS